MSFLHQLIDFPLKSGRNTSKKEDSAQEILRKIKINLLIDMETYIMQ